MHLNLDNNKHKQYVVNKHDNMIISAKQCVCTPGSLCLETLGNHGHRSAKESRGGGRIEADESPSHSSPIMCLVGR